MDIYTARFGKLEIADEDVILFADGLIGFEHLVNWILLSDEKSEDLGWLQSLQQPEVALAVVSPRRFAPEYRVRMEKEESSPLRLTADDEVFVLTIVSKHDDSLTINLRAPVVINLTKQLGRQIVTTDEQPLQFEIQSGASYYRKSA
ncbi:flagellar assembly protein FliW [Blastopirellula sp. JC732]|uniref:Flagellar assembly factor FliW n=1 Tax=Blastopirellula sediminis TaxID=2894196 RepID=A0A9X1MMI2_9BACT|nr:flagellar assembly protein FliW [Blastopirellula sediminis]MCC9607665.1 flagellar assembly protein FliW [Blastopirellula sediminis]MCC9629042.1 flagellar assembly protein FliW [Blastopirellula sediminis]